MQSSRDIKTCLDNLLASNDKVFIVPHNRPDMDALGAAIGMSLICNKKGKENYIVIDDKIEKLDSVTRKVVDEIYLNFNIIKLEDLDKLISDKSLMIAVDVNTKERVCVKDYLTSFNDIMIIDHHNENENTIDTPHKYIDIRWSCACEEVTRLLAQFGVKITPCEANYLLAGIILDTGIQVPKPNVNNTTLSAILKLTNRGANLFYVNNLFAEDTEYEKDTQNLTNNVESYGFSISFDNTNKIYDLETIAKKANQLLRRQVGASFVIAYIASDTVQISARSKGAIDVSKVMNLFGGGGAPYSAAAQIKNVTVDEVKNKLYNILVPQVDFMQDVKEVEESGPQLKLVP